MNNKANLPSFALLIILTLSQSEIANAQTSEIIEEDTIQVLKDDIRKRDIKLRQHSRSANKVDRTSSSSTADKIEILQQELSQNREDAISGIAYLFNSGGKYGDCITNATFYTLRGSRRENCLNWEKQFGNDMDEFYQKEKQLVERFGASYKFTVVRINYATRNAHREDDPFGYSINDVLTAISEMK